MDANDLKLVGREPEIKRLKRLVQRAADGTGSALLIAGEPGIGKTHLVRAAATIAKDAGLAVHIGYCEQLEVEKTLGAPLRAFNRQVNVDPERGAAVRTLLEAGASAAAGSALADRLWRCSSSSAPERQCSSRLRTCSGRTPPR